jgi:hypothetical protein
VTLFIDHLYTHDSWLHFTDRWHTQTSVLILLKVSTSRFLATGFNTGTMTASQNYTFQMSFSPHVPHFGACSDFGAWGWFLSFLIILQTVGLLERVLSSSQGLYLYTGQHKHRKTHTHQTSMPWVGFEPTIPVSERAKTVYALDRSVTVTGHTPDITHKFFSSQPDFEQSTLATISHQPPSRLFTAWLSTDQAQKSKSKSHCDWRSVSQ